jgi:hypothetical protein
MRGGRSSPTPFALSLSKGAPSHAGREGEGFDGLSPNGFSTHSTRANIEALP